MSVVYYQGERIYFRPLESADVPVVKRWINDPRNWATLHMRPPTNDQREREWIENQGKSSLDWSFGIARQEDDRLIGTCGLHGVSVHGHSASVGINLGEVECQNHGYGTEAMRLLLKFGFTEINLHRIELSVFDHNPRAIRVYEKVGFVCEGRRREASFRNGCYRDIFTYGILRREWQALQPADSQTHVTAQATPA